MDGGTTWASSLDLPSVNDPSAPNGSLATFNAITSVQLPNGESQLVATGRIKRVNNAAGVLSGQWLTVRSRDVGATWEAIDEYTHDSYNQISGVTAPRGVALDQNGNIYVVGSAEETVVGSGRKPTTTTVDHWLIRKGVANADGSVTWSIVGDIPFTVSTDAEKANTYPSCVACVGNNVFVGGGGGSTLQVWKSSDAGANWQVILSTYRLNSVDQWHAFGIAGDSLGHAYVVGQGYGLSSTTGQGKNATTVTDKFWFVMKESADGTYFSQLGSYYRYPVSNGTAGAYAVTVAPNDDVFVTGYGASPTAPIRWVTRQYAAATGAWTTTDDFSLSPTGYAEGRGITSDPFGHVFVAGVATNPPNTQYGWLVRRKLTP